MFHLSRAICRSLIPWLELSWPLDWEAIFGRPGRLVVEIGFGNGRFVEEKARTHPEENFVGIERSWGSVTRLLRRIERHGLENVRILQGSAGLPGRTPLQAGRHRRGLRQLFGPVAQGAAPGTSPDSTRVRPSAGEQTEAWWRSDDLDGPRSLRGVDRRRSGGPGASSIEIQRPVRARPSRPKTHEIRAKGKGGRIPDPLLRLAPGGLPLFVADLRGRGRDAERDP